MADDLNQNAMRFQAIVDLASKGFGDQQLALKWLQRPMARFQGRTPMDMLATEGALTVEESLHQIDHGMFA